MPYILPSQRSQFKQHIQNVLSVLKDPADNQYLKGEHFGYFVNRLVRRFMRVNPEWVGFNSFFFHATKKKTLEASADAIGTLIGNSDPMNAVGEFNYVVSSVLWGFLGECEGHVKASYGMRAYLTGIIQKIYSNVESLNSGSQADSAMSFRRHLIIRGVLHDVLSETYRLKTSVYEDEKALENGEIWKDGKLVDDKN
jgi:hypothetical protein